MIYEDGSIYRLLLIYVRSIERYEKSNEKKKRITCSQENKLPYTYDDVKWCLDTIKDISLEFAETYYPIDNEGDNYNYDILSIDDFKHEIDNYLSKMGNKYNFSFKNTRMSDGNLMYNAFYDINFMRFTEDNLTFELRLNASPDLSRTETYLRSVSIEISTVQVEPELFGYIERSYSKNAYVENYDYEKKLKRYFTNNLVSNNALSLDKLLDFVDERVYSEYSDPEDLIYTIEDCIEEGGWQVVNKYKNMRNPYKFTISNGKQKAKFCVDFDKEYLGPDEGYAVSINSLYYE